MDAPTLPVSTGKNLGDPIEIRVDNVHPALADVFPAATEMNALRFRMGMEEEENASLRGKIKTIEVIDIITRRQEKMARMELERQLASVQESQRQDQENFRKLQEFGTEGVIGLSQRVEKMESVFHISGCSVENQVKFATYTLLGAALTWWNGHVRTLGHDATYAMTWEILKKKLTDKYCPKELALMCTKFISNETEKVDKYNSGLPDNIHGNVMSARLKTLDDAIELANDLMDQKLHTYVERQAENKRKLDNKNQAQQQFLKKQNVVQAYAVGTGEKKPY
nr:hypothetical protein [Tanacetum cinerariifolium]